MPVCIENYDCFYDPIPSLYKQLRQVKNPLSKDLRTHSYFIPSRGGVFLLPPLALLLLLYRLQLAQRRKRDAFRCSANVIHPCRFSCKSAKETASYIIIHIFHLICEACIISGFQAPPMFWYPVGKGTKLWHFLISRDAQHPGTAMIISATHRTVA